MAAAAGDDPARQLAPFLARAEEISSIDPRVAYYLRLYAWKKGQAVPNRTDKLNGILDALATTLERERPRAGLQDLQRDLEHVSQFGLKVFSNADTVVRWLIRRSNEHDRRGKQDATTALAFSAASSFLDALHVFNQPLKDEIEAKLKFAAWRAADLSRRLAAEPATEPAAVAPGAPSAAQQPPLAQSAQPPPLPQTPQAPQAPVSAAPPPAPHAMPLGGGFDPLSSPLQPPTPPETAGAAPSAATFSSGYPGDYPSLGAAAEQPSTPATWEMGPSTLPPAASAASASPADGSPACAAPWRPVWGLGVSSLAAGDRVLYRTQGDSFIIASVIQVDRALDPPAFCIDVDGSARNTEADRLALPPRPRLRNSATSEDSRGELQPLSPPAPPSLELPSLTPLQPLQPLSPPAPPSLELPSLPPLQPLGHDPQQRGPGITYAPVQPSAPPPPPQLPPHAPATDLSFAPSASSGYVSLGPGGPPFDGGRGAAAHDAGSPAPPPPRSWEASPAAQQTAPQQAGDRAQAGAGPPLYPSMGLQPASPGQHQSHAGATGAHQHAWGAPAEAAPAPAPALPPPYMAEQHPAGAAVGGGVGAPSSPQPWGSARPAPSDGCGEWPSAPHAPQTPAQQPYPPAPPGEWGASSSAQPQAPGPDPEAAAAAAAAAAEEREWAAAVAAAQAASAAAAAARPVQPSLRPAPGAGAGGAPSAASPQPPGSAWDSAPGPSMSARNNGGSAAELTGQIIPPRSDRVQEVINAQKLCGQAVASIKRDDVADAVHALRNALHMLTSGGSGSGNNV